MSIPSRVSTAVMDQSKKVRALKSRRFLHGVKISFSREITRFQIVCMGRDKDRKINSASVLLDNCAFGAPCCCKHDPCGEAHS